MRIPPQADYVLKLLSGLTNGTVAAERALLETLGHEVTDHGAWWGRSAYRDSPADRPQSLPGITSDAGRAISWIERKFPKASYYVYRTDRGDYVAQIGMDPRAQYIHPHDAALALSGAVVMASVLTGRIRA